MEIQERKGQKTVSGTASIFNTMGRNQTIRGTWKIGDKIGSGAFGTVHAGKDIRTGEAVAIKKEKPSDIRLLHREYQYLRWLQPGKNSRDIPGIPRIMFFGSQGADKVMVMDMLGPSLQDLLESGTGHMSMKSVLMIGIQALRRLEHIHSRSLIHRDIKPENMLVGLNDRSTIYMVDFGLAKPYRDFKTHVHRPYRTGKAFTGTYRYASLNAHDGNEQSRRDDLESLGYVLVYLSSGYLPWMGIRASNKKGKDKMVVQRKRNTKLSELCQGMPKEVKQYFRYVRDLKYMDKPNYAKLRRFFQDGLQTIGKSEDNKFDWIRIAREPRKSRKGRSRSVFPR